MANSLRFSAFRRHHHPCTRAHTPAFCRHRKPRPCTRAHVLPSACHCEPVRTLVWQSVFPAGKPGKLAAVWANPQHLSYSPEVLLSVAPCRRVTDCHVASLLAMTCCNMRLSAVATAWCQANLSRFRIRPRRYFLLCPAAGEADCHVAALLAMTCRNLLRIRVARTYYPACAFTRQHPLAPALPSSLRGGDAKNRRLRLKRLG